jgi:hypothetical protein
MQFTVEKVKTVQIDSGEGDEIETWFAFCSDKDGNKLTLTTKDSIGLHPGDELELRKASGQSSLESHIPKEKKPA